MAERVTVLHVVPEDSYRGAQVYAGRLRDALTDDPEQHHLVLSLFASGGGAMQPDLSLDHASGRLRRAGLNPLVVTHLRRTIRCLGASIVVAHGGEALKYVVLAHGRARVVYYKVGLSTAELARPSRLRLYRFLVRHVALGVGVSKVVRDQMQDALGMPPARLRVVPNGRPPDLYYPASPQANSGDTPLVLWIGHLEPGKRPGLFIEAIRLVRASGIPFDAAIVGVGPLREQLQEAAHIADVSWLGTRDDVPELLRSATLMVMTSAPDTEGMPGVLVEAGLSGIPVVSGAAAGVNEVVDDGVTGYVVDAPDEADHLAQRIVTLLRSPELCVSMGVAGRKRCLTLFTIDASAAKWRETIESVAGSRVEVP